jgi:circadian clock protein KaiC
MTTKIRQLQRVTTGVPGFDFITDGGLFETGVYIIQGAAGAGKTIFANQICFHQAEQKRTAVYYTLLTEAHDRMLSFLQHMRFFDAKLVSQGVNYVSGFKLLESEGLPGVVRSIRDLLSAQRPALLAVDGLVTAEEIAPNDTAFKKFLHEIQTVSTMFRCTVVDGIITLTADAGTQAQRTVEVSKFRGAGQHRGTHSFEISSHGITIRPRVETILKPSGSVRRQISTERLSIGVPELDTIMGGGLLQGSKEGSSPRHDGLRRRCEAR